MSDGGMPADAPGEMDGAVIADGGGGVDAPVAMDAAVVDAGDLDGSVTADGGVMSSDGSMPTDGGLSTGDGAMMVDGGGAPPMNDGGCGCTVPRGDGHGELPIALVTSLAILLGARRRSRRSRR